MRGLVTSGSCSGQLEPALTISTAMYNSMTSLDAGTQTCAGEARWVVKPSIVRAAQGADISP